MGKGKKSNRKIAIKALDVINNKLKDFMCDHSEKLTIEQIRDITHIGTQIENTYNAFERNEANELVFARRATGDSSDTGSVEDEYSMGEVEKLLNKKGIMPISLSDLKDLINREKVK